MFSKTRFILGIEKSNHTSKGCHSAPNSVFKICIVAATLFIVACVCVVSACHSGTSDLRHIVIVLQTNAHAVIMNRKIALYYR